MLIAKIDLGESCRPHFTLNILTLPSLNNLKTMLFCLVAVVGLRVDTCPNVPPPSPNRQGCQLRICQGRYPVCRKRRLTREFAGGVRTSGTPLLKRQDRLPYPRARGNGCGLSVVTEVKVLQQGPRLRGAGERRNTLEYPPPPHCRGESKEYAGDGPMLVVRDD